ncbi:hypothetical protein F5148DRAFT_1293114 [Russula earlei]|uniref:Uncharacterized protein n=1 Tax=Russula earlei TaxID=71964 RepID=A0ACC0TTB7_9AGAM|nr:hypothetical protein F5148DRAFT_1293114 [Russula earlei]
MKLLNDTKHPYHESQQPRRKKSQVHTAVTDDENPASTKEVPQPVSSPPIETVQVHEETPIWVDVFDVDGFLADIDVQAVPEVLKTTLKDCSHDVDHFFSPSYQNKRKNY